jgi:hypothetical protein
MYKCNYKKPNRLSLCGKKREKKGKKSNNKGYPCILEGEKERLGNPGPTESPPKIEKREKG